MKLDADKVKNQSVGKFSKTTKATLLVVVVVILAVAVNFMTSMGERQRVEVVKLANSVPQNGPITQEMMYKDTMSKAEYEKSGVYTFANGDKKRVIVLWSDREKVQDAYAAHYIRQDTELYWDALSKETAKEHAYLYKMDGELLKIDIDAGQFGSMLVPGDKINVRVTYAEKQYTLPSERDFVLQQQMGVVQDTTVQKSEMLFSGVSVLDILNAEGESIFDIYYKLISLPKTQQYELAQTEEFKTAVQPVEILLNVTAEEADRYMSIMNSGPKYMMTLLPRSSGNVITEALSELNIGFSRE